MRKVSSPKHAVIKLINHFTSHTLCFSFISNLISHNCLLHWNTPHCFNLNVSMYAGPVVYECAYSDPLLFFLLLSVLHLIFLPPGGFCCTKLQSLGPHWSATVWGLLPREQLGIPRQQLQFYTGRPGEGGGSPVTGNRAATSHQWTWNIVLGENIMPDLTYLDYV